MGGSVQSASVTALLTLDASGFHTGIENSIKEVDKFVSSLGKANTNYENFRKAVLKLENTMGFLNNAFQKFNVESSKAESFNKIANGLNTVIKSARSLAESNVSLKTTYQSLRNVVNMFGEILSQQEIKLKGNIQLTRQLAEVNSQANGRVRVAGFGKNFYEQNMAEINSMIAQSEKARAEYQRLMGNLNNLNGAYKGVASSFNATNSAFSSSANTIGRLNAEVTKSSTLMANLSTSANRTASAISHMVNSTNSESSSINKLVTMANGLTTSLERATTSAQLFGSQFQLAMSESASSMQYLNNATQSFGIRLNPALNQTSTNLRNVTTASMGIPVTMNSIADSTNRASNSTKQLSQGMNSGVSSANRMNTATRGLTGTMNGLRMAVGMVASMFLFNFAHNMLIAVKSTIESKSEMLSFLNAMGMTQNQIEHFNGALDNTIARFQRVNKYHIGETVANIGMEFDLSAEEMERAMTVTSMVTSEYLRAGRSADEAALAVKDIMQGQFQRLSRETGVKQDTLEKLGWSGNPEDVLGLMDALEKAGKARHWDDFAAKATSLNDIVLITQNRLSEWATDMSDGIVPIVTGAFNMIVDSIDFLTGSLMGIGEALNLPDWTGTALLITGFGIALTGLFVSTVTARTGLGLLGIAHNGLSQSIIATIFNIKAEEMANQSASKIAMGRLLGLNSEVVARNGLKSAMLTSIATQQLENATKSESTSLALTNVTAQELENMAKAQGVTVTEMKTIVEKQNALAEIGTTKAILTHLLSLDARIVKEQGLLVALGATRMGKIADKLATDAETVSETTLNAVRLAGIAIMGIYLAALLAIAAVAAVFLIPMINQMNDANSKMKEFNELIKDGDNLIRDARKTVESYSSRVEKLKEELGQLTEGSDEYRRKQYELTQATNDLNTANQRYRDTISAVERARSSQARSEEQRTETAIHQNQDMIQTLMDLGYSYDQAAQKAGQYYDVIGHGTRVMQDLANHEEYNRGRLYDMNKELADQFKTQTVGKATTPEELADRMGEYSDIISYQNKEYEKFMTSEGWGDYIEHYLGWQWGKAVEGWMHFEDDIRAGDIFDIDETFRGFLSDRFPSVSELPKLEDIAKYMSNLKYDILKPLGELDKWITDNLNNFNKFDLGKFFQDKFIAPFNGFGDAIHNFMTSGFGNIFNNLKKDWDNFWKDLGNIFGGGGNNGNGMQMVNMPQLLNKIFNFNDSIAGITEWFNNSIVTPLTEVFNVFLSDPLSLLGGIVSNIGIGDLLNNLFGGSDVSGGAVSWIQTNIVQQFSTLPTRILNYILQSATSINDGMSLWVQYGSEKVLSLFNTIQSRISGIPSLVWNYFSNAGNRILETLSVWVGNARKMGTDVVDGVKFKLKTLPDVVYNEFMEAGNRIKNTIGNAVNHARDWATQVVNATKGFMGIASPGYVQRAVAKEFADIPGRIAESSSQAQTEAGNFGSAIVSGMGNQITNIQATAQMMSQSMNQMQPITDGSFVGEYQSDANAIYGINAMMTTDTTTAFNTMGDTVNTTIGGMTANLQTSYSNMNTSQTTALTTMQNQNKTAYTNLQNQTTSSLNNMRNTTQNVTLQMVNAWNHMKDNIIYSADQLKTQSTAHFNQLSSNIGGFYQKLQNPSMWGGGDYKMSASHYSPHRGLRGANEVKRAFGIPVSGGRISGRAAGGPSPSSIPERMTLKKLKSLVGNSPIFNGLDMNQEVNVAEFMAANGLSLGWGDWHNSHFDRIKSTSGEWDMRGPQIMHRIDTGTAFKVKEFYNSRPQISFGSFQKMAEALFSAIPYEYYFNSDAHGSWVGALQAGSCNCVDGANALIALAATCGFSGHTQGGTWNGIPHVYAVINGKKMDTTGWQQRRDWNGVAAGSPSNMRGFGENKTVNVNIDMTNATFNGEDDFEEKMRDVAKRVIGEEVNTSITVGY